MVSLLRIGLRAPSAVFKRKSSKKMACIDKETDPTSDKNIEKSLSNSTDHTADDLMEATIWSVRWIAMTYTHLSVALSGHHPLLSISKYVTEFNVTKSVNSSKDGPVATIPLREAVLSAETEEWPSSMKNLALRQDT